MYFPTIPNPSTLKAFFNRNVKLALITAQDSSLRMSVACKEDKVVIHTLLLLHKTENHHGCDWIQLQLLM